MKHRKKPRPKTYKPQKMVQAAPPEAPAKLPEPREAGLTANWLAVPSPTPLPATKRARPEDVVPREHVERVRTGVATVNHYERQIAVHHASITICRYEQGKVLAGIKAALGRGLWLAWLDVNYKYAGQGNERMRLAPSTAREVVRFAEAVDASPKGKEALAKMYKEALLWLGLRNEPNKQPPKLPTPPEPPTPKDREKADYVADQLIKSPAPVSPDSDGYPTIVRLLPDGSATEAQGSTWPKLTEKGAKPAEPDSRLTPTPNVIGMDRAALHAFVDDLVNKAKPFRLAVFPKSGTTLAEAQAETKVEEKKPQPKPAKKKRATEPEAEPEAKKAGNADTDCQNVILATAVLRKVMGWPDEKARPVVLEAAEKVGVDNARKLAEAAKDLAFGKR